MSNNEKRKKFPRGGRGGRVGHSARDHKNQISFKERKFKDENRKELSLHKIEAKENKKFKGKLCGDDTEKVIIPTYEDNDPDESLLILVKEFNMMIDNVDLFKVEDIGEEDDRSSVSALKKRHILKAIKEVF